ncbi:MAG: hypothetical protein JXR49_05170 [Acidobacteria bacterium]|nr:hypothetical protein [Acidobacteriota bacterium]
MTLYKFKTFEEAEKQLWCFEPDEAYYKSLRALFRFFCRINPPSCPAGIFKYRSLADADRQKKDWDMQNAMKRTGEQEDTSKD